MMNRIGFRGHFVPVQFLNREEKLEGAPAVVSDNAPPAGRIGFRRTEVVSEDAEVVPAEFAAECAADGGE